MAVQFNADFNRFVEFATAQHASGKVIADAVNGKFDVGGLSRSIEVASGDKVGAWSRSQTAKDVNNVTRDIFHNAVVSMFGGESKIPASVLKAMEMKNFGGAGRPLTAKRIMAVKVAIDRYNARNPGEGINIGGPGANLIAEGLKNSAAKMDGVKTMSAASIAKDMKPVALTLQKANKMIGKSLDLLGYILPGDQKASLAAMLLKYGNNMPAKNQRVLSNYIGNKAITVGDVDEEDVASLAKGDPHMQAALASLFTVKYGSIIVMEQMTYAEANPLFGLRQNLFTDPQKPMKVQPGIYPINGADENSICLTTVDFALTYFVVSGELERSGVPCNLIINDAGGLSVLTSWAAGKFSSSSIAKFFEEAGINEKVKCRKLCIPGKVAVLKGELEAKMPGWEIIVAPREAVQLVKFLKDMQ